jgi:hypothetical protein
MNEPIVSREFIAQQADDAAREMARTGQPARNPYPPETAAAAAWKASLQRQLLWHTAPQAEGSA